MSEITNQLKIQLKNNKNKKVIKDESLNRWFNGAELGDDVQVLKNTLIDLHIGLGDVVLVCLPNSAVYPILTQALWEIGAVMHPISATTPEKELQQELVEHDYVASIVGENLVNAVLDDRMAIVTALHLQTYSILHIIRDRNLMGHDAAVPDEDDLALILNTSGTTGKPKRVGLTHKILKNAVEHDIESHKMTSNDTTMIVMPMFHINAQAISILSTRLSGGKIVVTEKFSASKFWNQVRDNGVTWVSVVPTIVNILLINQKSLAAYSDDIKLRFVRCSSFALPLEKLTEFQTKFHTQILEGYGLTETASQCTINPFDKPKVGSAGKAFKTDVEIMNDGKIIHQANQIGEIVVRGDHVISSYLDPHPDSFKDGWFLTGDLGYLDEDNYLFVKGRKKDIINRGGEKVAPAQVENVISQLNFVKEVSVIATPDSLYGEAVTAVVITRGERSEELIRQKIMAHAKATLAKYEQPTRIFFVQDYPRNATGKVIRVKLREQVMSSLVGKRA
ncbi:AMP-binding protein [Companilactobacillus alimentarius]|uniref:Acyl-CoA synthetase n=1 Tax=Companilactobacillus alimentarius DSM 20249 TaxID=1423720 RepID=A0A2K9HIM7_9LACO|nr:AMP-binding protein [Companilactobacillus alimentarius]AUI72404.1 acyl-CoA synthetase [Companilactobacillus alimentarius DSM 20249]KRK75851.1 Acyl-CoA synthetase family protein [Companilactobacillus alimentarius DSM 20249]GEO45828.1 acyl-CoA synthetase [Companilactobacillus alimentarius]